ncbi:uncharacterized protein [Garra rufa]|uniref:uncharacterized protein n=1 Tax=Garra rufa TaxID=137080 RepID=UPI003CCE8E44
MEVKLLFLTVVLLSSALLTLCDPLFILSAPNLLRVGSSENVFVEAQDYSGGDLNVRIIVKKFPKKDKEILSKSVMLTVNNNFQILTDIKIPDDKNFFSDDPLEKQYVYLQAQFPSTTLEKTVMLSFQSGYIFVQTDKPIYTPASTVNYRIFSVMPNMTPLSQSEITVEIMNPQNITVSSEKISPVKGIKSGQYSIPEITSTGIWKVVTLFSNTPQKKFTAHFEVKEYVLPTIEVKLKPSKSFFYVSDESLTVDIEAKYLFGKKVDGNAFVVFGVIDNMTKTSIPASLQKVQIVKGEGTAKLTNQMITATFSDINQLVDRSIYVSVSLLTLTGSEMVEAERRGIQIVTSPYTIHFKKTPHFFKPGMPFDVSVFITNPDKTPAVNVDVEVVASGEAVKGQTRDNGIAKVSVNTLGKSSTLHITAKTKDPKLRDEQQAVKTMTAQAYIPKGGSKNYLHIGIDAAELQIGNPVKVNLNTEQSPGVKDQDYTYMILSKGQIVQVHRFKRKEQALVTLPVTVTKDMVPSFRFVAYYHVGSSEVVSDSVWVDVKDTCMGKLQLNVKDKQIYETGDKVNLQITGDPGARVGLVVVDKAVHVLNKNRLTQTQIWDVIEKHDIGCTAGSGRDSMGVFTDAGLMFESNTAGGTNTRTMPECPKPAKRKRRTESLLKITSTLGGQYSGELKQCCVDGMRNNKLGYTCERRAMYIVDGPKCVEAFLHCCNEMKTQTEAKTEEEETIMARSDDDDDDDDGGGGDYCDDSDKCTAEPHEIESRTEFPESWLWEEVDLPVCEKCKTSIIDKVIQLKDSITTWQILAVSLSPTLGICVAEPEEMVVQDWFFIDLKMPYSTVRGEQLEIKAIIHNYTPMNLKTVNVYLMETKHVCSFASKEGKYQTTLSIDKGSSKAVSFVIIPMTLGDHIIEVKASAYDFSDGVRKTLKVVSEGVLSQLLIKREELNPAKNGENPINVKADKLDDRVSDTPANMYISITGKEIGQSVEQAINGDFMGRLIVQPSGCGEQNMIYMTLPLTATHYLDSTKQWETIGIERRNEAINHINRGYQQQLSFRKSDGSYGAWIHRPSSTWLTAYVAKVFAMASNLVTIKDDVLCNALKWLVLQKQLGSGSFKEEAAVIHGEMVGDVRGKDADASLTAFVLIAMQEGRKICAPSVANLNESISKAVSFLEGRLPQLTNPYAVALTSYAMANEKKLDKDILMKHSTQGEAGRSWTVPGQHYHSLEATAYAVLALVKAEDYDKAGEAVHWLNRQQSHYGGSGTTQATIMVFQAVAEYRTQLKDQQNFNLDVELSMAGSSTPKTYTVKRDNAHLTWSEKLDINQEFTVTAKGTGTATLSVLVLYYARPVKKTSDCTFFDLTVKIDRDTTQGANEAYKLTMDFIFKSDESIDATMTVIDVGLLTGFNAEESDLKELSRGKDRYIMKYEKNKELSERGSLILYLDKASHTLKEIIAFRMNKVHSVGQLHPAAVTIYEYYSPDKRCTKFYQPEEGARSKLCSGDLCQCADEENANKQIKRALGSQTLTVRDTQTDRMDVKLLFLTVVLLSSALLTLCDPLFILSAPNLLRVGSSENVFVEAQDYSGGDVNIKISVKNFPKKEIEILTKSVTLTAANNFQILTDIKIPDDNNFFSDDPLEKQYVYLQAQFPSTTLEKVVMLSFQSGYIFVQTDKPIYTPASTVRYRIFSLMPNLTPQSESEIIVEIMNSQGITVSSEKIKPVKGMKSGRYTIPEIASSGIWKVVTRFKNTLQKTFTADFEVKEYVLPTFEVKIKPSRSFFYVGDESLKVDIEARYLFGQKVDGNAFVVFGVMDREKKTIIPTSLQKVQIMKGEGTAELTNQMITKTFPNINQLVGQSIYFSVSLLTESGSEMVKVQRKGIQIVTSPYTIDFKRTPQFFKPGLPYNVWVYVTNPDQMPVEIVEVEVNPGGAAHFTRADGIAKFTIMNTGGSSTLEITAKTRDPQLKDEQQAVKKMTAQAYKTKDGSDNYIYIGIDYAELQIGEQVNVYLSAVKSPGFRDQDYTYMILSKGKIIKVDRCKSRGQAQVALPLTITKDMVPSFRFVAYYHVGSSEVVSDSVWVDVKDTCMGTLQIKVKNKVISYSTDDKVKLQITGDPGAKVGLVVVDKSVNLINRNRLTQTQIWDVIEKHDIGCTAGCGRDSMGVFTDAGLMFESNTAGGTNTRTSPECPFPSKRRRRSDDDPYTDSEDIVSRTQFPESWLWEEIELCENCQTPATEKEILLKDSLTTWQILAVSLSPTLGICVAEPEEIYFVFKPFFIDLKMPYSAVRGEQLEIKAIIHNYSPMKQKVRVEFMETKDVCSFASKKGKHRTIVNIEKDSSISVSYVIIPMTLGNHMIELKASAYDSAYDYGVRKTLNVVSEGVLIPLRREKVELNPAKNGETPLAIKAVIPADRVPDTPADTYISITGEEITQTVEKVINGGFMGRLIIQPSGNGEENMIRMTLPLIATHYLDSTNQWETIGIERRIEAIKHISTGYQQQLNFRKSDGSYAALIDSPSSTWLTAYVAKVFAMVYNLVSIDDNVLCSALKWLVLHKQTPNGSFKEDSAVMHGEMVGDIRGKDADVSLTAFVVIAMQESREICAGSVAGLHLSITTAVSFLEGRLPQLTNPYAVAMTSYAMANENKLNKDILMRHSTPIEAGRSWTVPGQQYHSLEATAYAVLALVKAKDFNKAGEAVHWLNSQKSQYGGSGTTQATIMVFQAVAEYRTQAKDQQNFNLEVELSMAGTRRPMRFNIKRDNAHLTWSQKVGIDKDFSVTARGTGTATLSVLTVYYARPTEKKSDCTFFDLTVKMEKNPERRPGAIESYKLTMDFYYKNDTTDATMTILDIGLPTGFVVEENDLKELSTGKEGYIQKFDMNKVLSERGSLILYLDKVLRSKSQRIAFRMNKMFDVGLLPPAAVTIYEYYSPDARCTKSYHPDREDGALYRLCKGDLCYCAEENCSYQRKNYVRDEERLVRACEIDVDYVYKVNVVEMDLKQDSDIYDMKVELVLKEGTDEGVEGKIIQFLARPGCRAHLGLVKGKSYLIMGKSDDLSNLGGSLQYVFGEQTWVEYWPTREESQTPEHRERYIGITELKNSLLKHGCTL